MSAFIPSLLDKLIGITDDRYVSGVVPRLTLDQFKECLARDLESLLNTRAIFMEDTLKHFPDVKRSIWTYGLCDLAGMSLASLDDRAMICRAIEQSILHHESRLREVKAFLEPEEECVNSLKFCISAVLILQDVAEPVSFDAVMQPSTLKYSISHRRRKLNARKSNG